MSQDEKEKAYTKFLFHKLFENRHFLTYDLVEECIKEVMNSENRSSTLEQISQFSDSFTRDLNLIVYQVVNDEENQINRTCKYIINGMELTRDYYSIRTDAPRIIGETAQTLNSRVNKGIMKCLPQFKTKKVSAEELYNYYIKYVK
jgi:hypothetical protein